jgi:hypothetical protein
MLFETKLKHAEMGDHTIVSERLGASSDGKHQTSIASELILHQIVERLDEIASELEVGRRGKEESRRSEDFKQIQQLDTAREYECKYKTN